MQVHIYKCKYISIQYTKVYMMDNDININRDYKIFMTVMLNLKQNIKILNITIRKSDSCFVNVRSYPGRSREFPIRYFEILYAINVNLIGLSGHHYMQLRHWRM